MKDLIERLEKATGPDQELNCAIWLAEGGPGFEHRARHLDQAPDYTASIDAALTLVPKNHRCTICTEEVTFDGETIKPEVLIVPFCEDYRWVDSACKGATPAIALCIAALKARMLSSPVRTEGER